MKSAEDRLRYDAAHVLDGAVDRRILVERPMSPQLIIVGSILRQDPAQMCLAQDDEMVHAFASDRSDQPFGKAVLPRRGWCSRFVPDAHGAQSTCDDGESAGTLFQAPFQARFAKVPLRGERHEYFCLRRCRQDQFSLASVSWGNRLGTPLCLTLTITSSDSNTFKVNAPILCVLANWW
jgi:hypothetical protein